MSEYEFLLNGVKLVSKILDIDFPSIEIKKINQEKINAMYIKEYNTIIFDSEWIKNANLAELMITCFHESRHAFQWQIINDKYFGKVNVNSKTKEIWEKEFNNYQAPAGEFCADLSYIFQDIEIDAITFSYIAMLELFNIKCVIPNFIKKFVLERAIEIKEFYSFKLIYSEQEQ